MSEIEAWGYIHPTTAKVVTEKGFIIAPITKTAAHRIEMPLYTKEQLDKAIEDRDILIRDLRKELNERRYGRSAS